MTEPRTRRSLGDPMTDQAPDATVEHARQSASGEHLFDESCPLCRAPDATVEAPVTKTGRALVALLAESDVQWPDPDTHLSPSAIRGIVIDIEREAAAHEVAEPAGLREAALAIKAEHDANGHREPCALCAALAVAQVPAERLDVERLARALWAWGFDATGPVIRDDVKEPTDGQRRMARKLANAYSDPALATPSAQDEGTPNGPCCDKPERDHDGAWAFGHIYRVNS